MKYAREQFITVNEAARLMGCTERHVRRCCTDGELAGARRDGGSWVIPISAHPALSAAGFQMEQDGSQDNLLKVAANKRDEAMRRAGVIKEAEKFAGDLMRKTAIGRKDAIEMYCRQNNIATRTLYRWMADYKREGILALVDMRGGLSEEQAFSRDAQEFFKALYLSPQQLSVKICYEMTAYQSKKLSLGWEIPSLRTVQNWAAAIPEHVRVLWREGKEAYEARFAPYIEKDPASIEPGSWWTGDHHQFNIFIRHRGTWVRPWITAWEDMGSRALVGWHISTGPNQSTIMIAMRRGIEKFGPPDNVKIDNGKDYDSRMFTGQTKKQRRSGIDIDEQLFAGIYGMMGIGASFAQPYHPQAKPIERFFDTLDCQFSKTFKTYCGKDSDRKPEELTAYLKTDKAIAESLTLEAFCDLAGQWIEAYNRTSHNGAGMEGRSPFEVMASRKSRRAIDPSVLDMLLCVWSGELKVGKNGVRFNGMNYGQNENKLVPGGAVRIAYNPDDLRTVAVYSGENLTFICHAEQNRLIKYGDSVSEEFVREAHAKKAAQLRAAKAYRDSARTAGLDITELAIAAKLDAAKTAAEEDATIRPVRTPLDGQGREYERQKKQQQYRLAAGAESMSLNLTDENPIRSSPRKLEIFDE
jgi:putative transposase